MIVSSTIHFNVILLLYHFQFRIHIVLHYAKLKIQTKTLICSGGRGENRSRIYIDINFSCRFCLAVVNDEKRPISLLLRQFRTVQ